MVAILREKRAHPITHAIIPLDLEYPSTREAFDAARVLILGDSPSVEAVHGKLIGISVLAPRSRDSSGNIIIETTLLP